MNRRKREVRVTPSGSVVDVETERWWLAAMAKPRVTVERLSVRDPFCQSVEADSRKRVA